MKKFLFILLLAGAGGYWYFVYRPQHIENAEASASDGAHGGSSGNSSQGGGAGGAKGASGGKGGRDSGPVPVVTGVVSKKDVPLYLNGLGNVQAFNTVTIRSRVDGQLKQVAYKEGQDVKAGDLLMQIDPDPFQATYDQAMAKKNQDVTQLANAKLDLGRYDTLVKQQAIATRTVDTQKALVDQLDATVKADDATIESAKVNLDYTRITSPLDGRVGIRLVDQGNIVHAADTTGLVVITQLKPIAVVFTLPEQTLQSVREQMENGTLKVLALGRDDKALATEGQLSVVDNQIDTTTGTIKLKATFANEKLTLWPGQFVNVRLQLTVRKGATVVPASVVQRGPEGTYAFVVKPDSTVDIAQVKVGTMESGDAIIEDGLKPGDTVIVDGQYRLQIGSKIKNKEAPAPKSAPGKGEHGDHGGEQKKGGKPDTDKSTPLS